MKDLFLSSFTYFLEKLMEKIRNKAKPSPSTILPPIYLKKSSLINVKKVDTFLYNTFPNWYWLWYF